MANLYQVTYQIHAPNNNIGGNGGDADLYRRDPVEVIVVAVAADPATLQTVILNNIPALASGEVMDILSSEQLVYGDKPIFQ